MLTRLLKQISYIEGLVSMSMVILCSTRVEISFTYCFTIYIDVVDSAGSSIKTGFSDFFAGGSKLCTKHRRSILLKGKDAKRTLFLSIYRELIGRELVGRELAGRELL